MFFTFPEGARWNAERQAVKFGVEIGEYRGVVTVPRRVFQRLLPERPTPEKCVEAYYLQRTRFETIAERKLRRRQLTEDGNVEIGRRDLGEGGPFGSGRQEIAAMMTVARRGACQMPMRWAYLNTPPITAATKITAAAKSNPATILPIRAAPRRAIGLRG